MNNPFGGPSWPGGMQPGVPPVWVGQQWSSTPGYVGPVDPGFYQGYYPGQRLPIGDPDVVSRHLFDVNSPSADTEAFYQVVTTRGVETARQELELAEQQIQAGRGFGAVSFVTRAFDTVNRVIAYVPNAFRPPEFGDIVQASMQEVAKVAKAVGAVGFTIGGGMTSGVYFELQFDVDKMAALGNEVDPTA